jgi:glutamyl-tRNA synthetase
MSSPRVRFAPSPTGYLHVGGARTALFNWLFARHEGGVFILRIEDTDVERSSDQMVTGILDAMRWLGLDWDEGPEVGGPHEPYFQSGRLERYRSMAEQLVRDGRAYYCYCTPDELKQRRGAVQEAASSDEDTGAEDQELAPGTRIWQYDRTCLRLSREEVAEREASGLPRAIRFLVPPGRTTFDDLVHGPVLFDNSYIEDFVVLRSDGHPTYHLSVVADDIDMDVTDVVRGDDHVSNTPKQVMLYEAFGRAVPRFAHVPLILGPDKKRLSKRHGATSVTEYKRQGYLPEAMVNFLALLGWSPGNDQEVLSKEELIRAFSLGGISSNNAVFNPEKLDWFNSQHIIRMPIEDLAGRVRPILEAAGLWRDEYDGALRPWYYRVLDLLRARAKKLEDFARHGRPFFSDTIAYDPAAVRKHLSSAELAAPLDSLIAALGDLPVFDAPQIELALRAIAGRHAMKAAPLIHAARVAVTGESVSPGIFEVLALLGRTRTVDRLDRARSRLNPAPR